MDTELDQSRFMFEVGGEYETQCGIFICDRQVVTACGATTQRKKR